MTPSFLYIYIYIFLSSSPTPLAVLVSHVRVVGLEGWGQLEMVEILKFLKMAVEQGGQSKRKWSRPFFFDRVIFLNLSFHPTQHTNNHKSLIEDDQCSSHRMAH